MASSPMSPAKMFSFTISDEDMSILERATEEYKAVLCEYRERRKEIYKGGFAGSVPEFCILKTFSSYIDNYCNL